MSLQHLTLGERIVMAARVMAAEHLRQDADAAGINVQRLQREMAIVRMNEARIAAGEAATAATRAAEAAFRQDLFRQPATAGTAVGASVGGDDDRRAA